MRYKDLLYQIRSNVDIPAKSIHIIRISCVFICMTNNLEAVQGLNCQREVVGGLAINPPPSCCDPHFTCGTATLELAGTLLVSFAPKIKF